MLKSRIAITFTLVSACIAASAQLDPARPDESGSVRIADTYHILVKDEASARRLRDSILTVPVSQRFDKFKQVARHSSIDPGSAPSGGNLGAVFEGEMVKSFETAVFESRANEVTGPFRSDFGWHLSYVSEFRSTPVAELCRPSLQAAYRTANARDKAGLALALEPVDRAALPDKISSLIGADWVGPLKDGDGNLIYVSTPGRTAVDSIRVVRRHLEYTHGKLVVTARPKACARSLRDGFFIDCEKKLIGFPEFTEFEGRAASGKRLKDFQTSLSKVRFFDIGSTGLRFQLYEYACHGTSLAERHADLLPELPRTAEDELPR